MFFNYDVSGDPGYASEVIVNTIFYMIYIIMLSRFCEEPLEAFK